MRKTIIIFMLMMGTCLCGTAQSFNQSDLIGTWSVDEDYRHGLDMSFVVTDSLCQLIIYLDSVYQATQSYYYYLSDDKLEENGSFDYTLVGKRKSGKYMICIWDSERSELRSPTTGEIQTHVAYNMNPRSDRLLGVSSQHLSIIFGDRVEYHYHR